MPVEPSYSVTACQNPALSTSLIARLLSMSAQLSCKW